MKEHQLPPNNLKTQGMFLCPFILLASYICLASSCIFLVCVDEPFIWDDLSPSLDVKLPAVMLRKNKCILEVYDASPNVAGTKPIQLYKHKDSTVLEGSNKVLHLNKHL